MGKILRKAAERPIRIISHRAFWDNRVGEEKLRQILEIAKVNTTLEARLQIINTSKFIDLDNDRLRSAFHDLVNQGVFDSQDEEEVFRDGTESEKFD